MAPANFQILSDLHLETLASYADVDFHHTAPHLALLGDIGHVGNAKLFDFIQLQLVYYQTVFFLLGNHEPHHMSYKLARSKLHAFEGQAAAREQRLGRGTSGRFVFLDQTRHDLCAEWTVLGCTLFSAVPLEQESAVEKRLTEFRDVARWTIDDYNDAHASDLAWLNAQVSQLAREEPSRKVVVFTHHCPSTDARSIAKEHRGSEVASGFATDLSDEDCWRIPNVKAWAYGHTHTNCDWVDEAADGDGGRRKRVVANQRGYGSSPKKTFNPDKVFVFE